MASVSATVSSRVMPRRNTAIASAATWPSEMLPSASPAMKKAISSAARGLPSRLARMISCGR